MESEVRSGIGQGCNVLGALNSGCTVCYNYGCPTLFKRVSYPECHPPVLS